MYAYIIDTYKFGKRYKETQVIYSCSRGYRIGIVLIDLSRRFGSTITTESTFTLTRKATLRFRASSASTLFALDLASPLSFISSSQTGIDSFFQQALIMKRTFTPSRSFVSVYTRKGDNNKKKKIEDLLQDHSLLFNFYITVWERNKQVHTFPWKLLPFLVESYLNETVYFVFFSFFFISDLPDTFL